MWKWLIPQDIKMGLFLKNAEGVDRDWWEAGSEQWVVAREDGEVADKWRRSFLRHGERPKQYDTKGTGCQYLFSV